MKRLFLLLLIVLITGCKGRPQLLWDYPTGAPVYASPAIYQDLLIIGSDDSFLYAIDKKSGKLKWKKSLNGKISSQPVISKNRILIGSGSGEFFCLNPADGKTIWTFTAGSTIEYRACVDETGIYFGSNDSHFYKVSHSGQKIWDYATSGRFWSHCEFYNDLVLTSSWDSNFYGLNRETGDVKWKVSSGTFNYGGPEVYKDTVYFATHDKLFRIDAETGKVLNLIKTDYTNFPIIWKNYLWNNEAGVLFKRTIEGAMLSSVKFPTNSHFRPVKTDKYLILGRGDNAIYAVSEDLKVLWKFKGSDSFWSAGVVDGGVYFSGNRDFKVYAIKLPR